MLLAEPLGHTQKTLQLGRTVKVVCSPCFLKEKYPTKNPEKI